MCLDLSRVMFVTVLRVFPVEECHWDQSDSVCGCVQLTSFLHIVNHEQPVKLQQLLLTQASQGIQQGLGMLHCTRLKARHSVLIFFCAKSTVSTWVLVFTWLCCLCVLCPLPETHTHKS